MKIPLLLLLLCTCSAYCLDCDGPQHNTHFGHRTHNDVLDYMDHLKADFKFLRIVDQTFKYPPSDEDTGSKLISYIEVMDQYSNGNGGCATLLTGGPGQNFTTIKITSKRNHGFDFIIRIFVNNYF